jgi:hypothetical protein
LNLPIESREIPVESVQQQKSEVNFGSGQCVDESRQVEFCLPSSTPNVYNANNVDVRAKADGTIYDIRQTSANYERLDWGAMILALVVNSGRVDKGEGVMKTL